MAKWFEIAVPAEPGNAEEIAALLATGVKAAQTGTELRSEEIVFWVEADRVEEALEETRRVARELRTAGFAVQADRVCSRPAVPEEEWRDAWKKHFHVTHLTRQLVIVPSWESYREREGDLVVHLDPGQAFGTGAHSSTRMVLLELQNARDQDATVRRFLDVGTGSGILAIAAAKLWPGATGEAIDTDPIAVDAALENCAGNATGEQVHCSGQPLAEIAGTYDLIMANIQADVLEELRAAITAHLAPGALLLLSGLLDDQVEAVATQYTGSGLALESIRNAEDDTPFSCARLRRTSGAL